jgi:hypothetical protein
VKDIPHFRSFPSASLFQGKPAKPDLSSARAYQFRTRIREGAEQPANFAGQYRMVIWGCGAECVTGVVVDLLRGNVVFLPFSVCCSANRDAKFKAIEFRPDSRLVVFSGLRNETPPDGAYFYDFDGKSFKFIRSVPAPAPKNAAGEVSADHTAAESQTSCGSIPDPTQRLACYDRVSGPQSESPPSEPTSAPFDHGFHFSENEFMRRFRKGGEEKGLAPVLRKETQNDEIRSHIYEVGERNMLFTLSIRSTRG